MNILTIAQSLAAVNRTIFLLFLTAIRLHSALPPTVTDAITADTSIDGRKAFVPKASDNAATMLAPQAPLITPQISPITSAQKLLTFSAFEISVFATFNVSSSTDALPSTAQAEQDATLTPITSKIILVITIKINNIVAISISLPSTAVPLTLKAPPAV